MQFWQWYREDGVIVWDDEEEVSLVTRAWMSTAEWLG